MENNIKLLYGPTEAHNVIMHRNNRLIKLTSKLKLLGYSVFAEKISEFDCLYIYLDGVKVFRCRLSALRFFDTNHIDKTLENAVNAVLEGKSRIKIAREYYANESNTKLDKYLNSGIVPV